MSFSSRRELFPGQPGVVTGEGRTERPPEAEERAIFATALLALALFPTLYLARRFDDNTLTSWRWIFHFAGIAPVVALHVLGIGAAYFISLPSRPPGRPAVVLFCLAALATVPLWSEPEVIIDASRYFTQAKHLGTHGIGSFLREWGEGIFAWTDLPLGPLIYGLVFRFLGESRALIQAATSLMFAATALLTFLIGRELWDEDLGFTGGLLLLASPYLLTQVPLLLVDIPTMFFSTLSAYLFIRALGRGGRLNVVLSSIAIILALLTKYSLWVFHGSLLAVILLVFLKETGSAAVLRRGAAVAALSAGLFGAILLLKFQTVESQLALLHSYQWPGLKRWGESFLSTFLFQVHPFVSLGAAASIICAVRRRDLRYMVIAWMWILVVLLQARRIRYLIPAMPMLALMAAYGFELLGRGRLKRFCAWCAVSFSVVTATALYLPLLENMSLSNLQAAGAYLDSRESLRAARVYTTHAVGEGGPLINPAVTVPLLDLFTSKGLVYAVQDGPPPFPDKIARSAYRFTWEYRIPATYAAAAHSLQETAVVVISGDSREGLPALPEGKWENYQTPVIFDRSAVFRFRTRAAVYMPKGSRGRNE